RQSEEDKRLLLDAAGEGIFGVDTAGRVTFVNPAALRMLGFAEGEMLGQNAHGLIHHSHEDGSNYPVEDCPMHVSYARTTDNHTADEVLWRKDGSSFHAEYSSMPITRDGKVMGAVVTFKDITTRKEMERILSESEEKFRKISMSARDAIIMMDSCGIITYWNEAAGRIFDYTTEEAVGKELHALLVPQRYYQSHIKGLGHFVKTGEGNAIGKTLELVAIRKNGAEFPIELSLSAVYLQDGWSAIGILRDITERKEAEETLQKSEQKFRALFEDSKDALYITTQQGRFIDFNQAYLELFGYTKEDMLALYAKDTYVNPDDRLTFVKMMEERGSVKDYEIKLRKKGGAGMECLMTATVKYADDGSILGYQGMIRDITELKHMEQQLHAMSLTDELTGLYNRRGFITLSEQQLKIAARTKKSMLLFFADLDKMKEINDIFGHKEGDKALISTAEVLRGVFRESDIIGRMGGDEFAILAIDAADGTGEALINRLRNTIDGRNRLEGMNYTLSLSTGVARYDPENPCSIDELMARADTLMYEEKRSKHH
ncbi:MAG: sensor domain-containing diguanylate cyclase, partial [Syntrophorhabdaceae bacterium]|nr:sensor domain-containing diguanylate cyclase [Syntrophorhabdaceae bacterium]